MRQVALACSDSDLRFLDQARATGAGAGQRPDGKQPSSLRPDGLRTGLHLWTAGYVPVGRIPRRASDLPLAADRLGGAGSRGWCIAGDRDLGGSTPVVIRACVAVRQGARDEGHQASSRSIVPHFEERPF